MPSHSTANFWGRPGACWHCHWFGGMTRHDREAWCTNPGCCKVRSMPENGCVSFEREPGADDEPHPVPTADTWQHEWIEPSRAWSGRPDRQTFIESDRQAYNLHIPAVASGVGKQGSSDRIEIFRGGVLSQAVSGARR